MHSLQKYFGDRQGPDGGGDRLFWPGGANGFPFAGREAPMLKQEETEELPCRIDFKCRMFKLWDEDDLREFVAINDRILNGIYGEKVRKDTFNEAHQHYQVWLEWYQVYNVAPSRGGMDDIHSRLSGTL